MTRIWLAIACIVVTTGVARAQLLSPGPLSNAHASIDGDNNCEKCHQSGKQVVDRLCLGCHKDLGAELDAARGLHGKQYKGKACESCHVEHVGRGAKLVRWPGGKMENLDHSLTGYTLMAGHTKPSCLDCHKKTSPLGKPVFLGTSTACASCHKDPHAGKFGQDCQSCHGLVEWKAFDRKAFDHKLARFPLTGKHETVGCEKCRGHRRAGSRSSSARVTRATRIRTKVRSSPRHARRATTPVAGKSRAPRCARRIRSCRSRMGTAG